MTNLQAGGIAMMAAATLALGAERGAAATFDLTGAGPDMATLVLSVDGIGLTISPAGSTGTPSITQNAGGIGVIGTAGAMITDGVAEIDSRLTVLGFSYGNDVILTFDQVVELDLLSFGNFEDGDDFGLVVDGNTLFGANAVSQADLGVDDMLELAAELTLAERTGTVFRLNTAVVDGGPFGTDDVDSFLLSEVTVTASSSEIPVPPALPLMLGALALLGYRARGRRS
ncbi:hypothetical protein LNKW23_06270 [Paralimibaculum aggregatum]|uniref:Secreted protein n=1 Tax=Paralimibaculum aggregatum TaxID=3036245 RepID=A0ABQ6LH41_9RHOB|nr:hypothetical protein [Limibaculum sp. NKW23]GMG81414.1 hypothetical protein LNKW23_06270 [Limibaculum sp. NKW23]